MWGALRGVAVAVVAAFLRLHSARLPSREGPARDLDHRSAAPARLRHGRATARANAHRATVRRLARGARQGGHHRRGRGRSPDHPARDAAQPGARLHADRARRRRPAKEEPSPARHPRARHDRTSCGRSLRRPPAGRAADRDPVRVGRVREQDRRDRARGARSREDAAGPARAHRRRLQPHGADPSGRGGGPPRPRAGGGRISSRSRGTSPTRWSSSRAPAARSAPSFAARSRASRPRGSSSSTTASPACSRSSASSSTSAASTRPRPCSPTPATRRRCARSSRSTGPASSSTPLRTSTFR